MKFQQVLRLAREAKRKWSKERGDGAMTESLQALSDATSVDAELVTQEESFFFGRATCHWCRPSDMPARARAWR